MERLQLHCGEEIYVESSAVLNLYCVPGLPMGVLLIAAG